MHGNELHHKHYGRASQHWDVPLTVNKRSFIRFTFWMDQELAMLEARWGGKVLPKTMQIEKQCFRSTDRLF